jgi:hypothetical protein
MLILMNNHIRYSSKSAKSAEGYHEDQVGLLKEFFVVFGSYLGSELECG